MDKFVVEGPTPLAGNVRVEGAKNAILPLMAAALLARGKSVISNVPDLRDVTTMVTMLDLLGARTTRDGDVLTIDSTDANGIEAPYDLVRTMRASSTCSRPLAVTGARDRAVVPGAARPSIRTYGDGKLGALELRALHRGPLRSPARGRLYFRSPVGATARQMRPSLAEGTTVKRRWAGIADWSARCRVGVEIGTDRPRRRHGTTSVKPLCTAYSDRIGVGVRGCGGGDRGDVTIWCNRPHGARCSDSRGRAAAVETQESACGIGPKRLRATDVVTREYPGFPPTCRRRSSLVLCCANGVHSGKTIYPDRSPTCPSCAASARISASTETWP